MPFIVVPDVMQVNVRYNLHGQQLENVLNFNYGSIGFSDAVPAIQEILETDFWPNVRGAMSQQLLHRECYFVDLNDPAGAVATTPPFPSPSGAITNEALPNAVAFCVTHRTAARGRSFRGRTYVPGLSEDEVASNALNDTGILNILNGFNNMRTSAETAGIPFVIVSRYENNLPRATGIDTPVEVSIARDNIVDTQRRRAPGRGR